MLALAWTGCGCGFEYGKFTERDRKPEEWDASVASTAALRAYLESHLRFGELVLHTCWSGDEMLPVVSQRELRPEDLGGDRFWLEERELLKLIRPMAGR